MLCYMKPDLIMINSFTLEKVIDKTVDDSYDVNISNYSIATFSYYATTYIITFLHQTSQEKCALLLWVL